MFKQKHNLVLKVVALVIMQTFIISSSVSAYLTLGSLSKVEKELRAPAFEENPGIKDALLIRLGGESGDLEAHLPADVQEVCDKIEAAVEIVKAHPDLDLPNNLGRVNFAEEIEKKNIVRVEMGERVPPGGQIAHAGVKFQSLYLLLNKADLLDDQKYPTEELTSLLAQELYAVVGKERAKNEDVEWSEELANEVHQSWAAQEEEASEKSKTAEAKSRLLKENIPPDFIDAIIGSMPAEHTETETVPVERLVDQVTELYKLLQDYRKAPDEMQISVKNPKDIYYRDIPEENISTAIDYTEIMVVGLDRPGFASDITTKIAGCNGNITSCYGPIYQGIAISVYEVRHTKWKNAYIDEQRKNFKTALQTIKAQINRTITDTFNILKKRSEDIELLSGLGKLNVYDETKESEVFVTFQHERAPPKVKLEKNVFSVNIHPLDFNPLNLAILIFEETIEFTLLKRIAKDGISLGAGKEISEFSAQKRHKFEIDLWSEFAGLSSQEREYFKALYQQFIDPQVEALVIKKNFFPSALLTAEQRKRLLGEVDYKDLRSNPLYAQKAQGIELILSPLSGGIGKKVGRNKYLESIWKTLGRKTDIVLGAKACDLFIELEIEEKKILISIAEAKLLNIIKRAQEGEFAKMIIEETVSTDTLFSVKTKFSAIYLPDRLDDSIPPNKKRTYEQIFDELFNLELREPAEESVFPTINKSSNLFTSQRLPGGHGLTGFLLLLKALEEEISKEKTMIHILYNDDGINILPDRFIANFMAEERIPIIMVTTTKTGLDMKGGLLGVVKLNPKGELVPANINKDILELRQAERANQEELFCNMGLIEGAEGAQDFNTNMVFQNHSVLIPLLKDLVKEKIITKEELSQILAPSFIPETTKDGKNTGFGGALGSVMLNLAAFLETSKDAKIQDLLEKHNISSVLRIVNVDVENRARLFTPLKTAFDFFLQFYSDCYVFNMTNWQLIAKRDVPPAVYLSNFYDSVLNCFEAFSGVSFLNLESLKINGKVKLPKVVLKGKVEIESQYEDIFDLNQAEELASLKQEGRLILENIKIKINKNGKVFIGEDIVKGDANISHTGDESVGAHKKVNEMIEQAKEDGRLHLAREGKAEKLKFREELSRVKIFDLQDLKNKRAVIINYQMFLDNPGIALVIENINQQLGEKRGLKLVLALDAPQRAEEFYEAVYDATEGGVDLTGQFDMVVSAEKEPKAIIKDVKTAFADLQKIEVIGHQDWALEYHRSLINWDDCIVIACGIGQGSRISQGGLALLVGLDALVSNGVLTPDEEKALSRRQSNEKGDFFAVESKEIGEEMKYIKEYQEEMKKYE